MRALTFTGQREVTVVDEPTPEPGPHEVLVRTTCSAISPGTELLLYRDEAPSDLVADETIDAIAGELDYPLRYGYACVGRVTDVGHEVDRDWLGRSVFAFRPHESHFTTTPETLHPIPDWCVPERAALLPNVEAAVNFAMDARPVVGERAVVLGQGVVGLLTTAVLAAHPLDRLVTLDRYALRREHSCALGADASIDPTEPAVDRLVANALGGDERSGADLSFELSGNPDALDIALDVTGFSGRVVIGSWYGRKRANVDLGGAFHRSRIRLVSSQVSTVDPEHTGRFSKARRLDVAWSVLRRVDVETIVTHRVPVDRADEAYRLLDERPDEAVQVLLTYD